MIKKERNKSNYKHFLWQWKCKEGEDRYVFHKFKKKNKEKFKS